MILKLELIKSCILYLLNTTFIGDGDEEMFQLCLFLKISVGVFNCICMKALLYTVKLEID